MNSNIQMLGKKKIQGNYFNQISLEGKLNLDKNTKIPKKKKAPSKVKLDDFDDEQSEIQINTEELRELNIAEFRGLIEDCIHIISLAEKGVKEVNPRIEELKKSFTKLSSQLPPFTISSIKFEQEIDVKCFLSIFLEILLKDLENHNVEVSKFYSSVSLRTNKNKSLWQEFLDSFELKGEKEIKFRNFRVDLILTSFTNKVEEMTIKYLNLIFSKIEKFIVMSVNDAIFKFEGINIKEILKAIISNKFVLSCFARVLNYQINVSQDDATIEANLLNIIEKIDKVCFAKYDFNSFLGMTIFTGDIILKKKWLDEIIDEIEEITYRADESISLTFNERLNLMNYSFTNNDSSKKKYFTYISFLIVTLLHEMVHIYRRKYINKNSFDNTPKFKLGNIEFDDGGDGVDYIMFGEILERISPMQAEFLLKVETWKFPLNEKDNFQTHFKNLRIIDKSQPIRLKYIGGGFPIGRCLRSLARSSHNN